MNYQDMDALSQQQASNLSVGKSPIFLNPRGEVAVPMALQALIVTLLAQFKVA